MSCTSSAQPQRPAFAPVRAVAQGSQPAPSSLPGNGFFGNQLGFLPSHRKALTIPVSAVPLPADSFRVRSASSGQLLLQAPLSAPIQDAASGDPVRIADFSSLRFPGAPPSQVRVEAAGRVSDPFPIRSDAYAEALRLAVRAFYGQRCGCRVDLGRGYEHPACHLKAAFHPSSGHTGEFHNLGGWHDAGDYGRYIVNSGISTGTLLWAWELFPAVLRSLHLDIPESGRSATPTFSPRCAGIWTGC